MHILEEFVVVNAPMDTVETVMTDREQMQRWMSPAVQFSPLDGWQFNKGARWKLTLTGLGPLVRADYVVHERRPGLVLWFYTGFWQGFDAWHWFPLPQDPEHQTVIQNRLEYELSNAFLDVIWPISVAPLMGWDARIQMQRLKRVCEAAPVVHSQFSDA